MQLSYDYAPAAGFPGMIADTAHNKHIKSQVNPAVEIPIGAFVTHASTGDDHVKLPTTSAEAIAAVGVAIQDWTQERRPGIDNPTFATKSSVPVMSQGRVWVKVEEAVAKDDPVFVRYASGAGGSTLGAARKTADTSTAAQLPGAKFLTSANAAGLAIVDLNLP